MRNFLIILAIIVVLALAYYFLIYKKREDEEEETDTIDTGTEDTGTEPVLLPEDYFVKGDMGDKEIVKRGYQAARDFMYINTKNPLVKKIYKTQFGILERTFCVVYGIQCNILQAIAGMSTAQKNWVINYLNNLRIDDSWVAIRNMAIGKKNTASVILTEAYNRVNQAGIT